jgi:hypothetical protein
MIKREGGGRGGKKKEEKEGEKRQMMRFKWDRDKLWWMSGTRINRKSKK